MGLEMSGHNTTDFDRKIVRIISPRLMSVIPQEEAAKNNEVRDRRVRQIWQICRSCRTLTISAPGNFRTSRISKVSVGQINFGDR